MISITFRGSASEVMSEMAQVVGAHGVSPIGGETSVEDKPAPRRGGRKPAAAAEPSAEGNSAASTDSNAPASTGAAASPTASTAQTGNLLDEVRSKCVAFGQPTKGGNVALKELLTQHGSAQGNFSGVPAENLPALNARLDELLAA